MKPYLSVIIPAYNEAERLPLTLAEIDRVLSVAEYSSEILVVDDGSKDNTAAIAERFGKIIKNLKVIKNKENHGKGFAVREGMFRAKGSVRLFTDADNSTSLEQFSRMMPYLKEGYGVVIGSRAVRGAKMAPPQPFYKRVLGRLGNWVIQLLVLKGIKDSQCGFKCFTEDAAKKIFSLAKMNSWGFDVEALALARSLGFKIKEMPVTWVNDPRSHVKLLGYLKTLRDVIRLKIWIWRNVYGFDKKEL